MAYRTVSFGVARSGLATIGYSLRASDGTLGDRVTAGVAEVRAGSGAYVANVDESSAPVGIVWDVESGSEVVAGEDFAAPTVAQIWAAAPAGDPLEDIAAAVWADAPDGTPLEDVAAAVRDVSNASPAAGGLGEAVNARASQTSVDGIAAKTTNLPSSPAAVGSAMVLSATGLDAIPTTYPAGLAATFPQMVVATFYRFFGKATKTATQIKTYAADGTTVVTTQAISATETDETQGAAS